MPTPDSFAPAFRAPGLRVAQLYMGLTAVVIPTASVVKHALDPGAVNPPVLYGALAVAAGLILGASAVSARVRARMRPLAAGYVLVELAWLAWLLGANQFDPDVAGAYLLMMVAAGALFATSFESVRPSVWLMAVAVAGVAGASAVATAPLSSPGLLGLYTVAVGLFQLATSAVQSRLTTSLRESRALYAEAETAGHIGSWAVDLGRGEARWSDGLCALLGVPPLGDAPAPSLEAYVHPDDLPAATAAFDALVRGDLSEHALETRITSADGRARTLRGVLRAERGEDGRVARVLGVATDVTAEASHQARLVDALDRAEAAARLKEAILANMSHEIRTPLTAVIGYAELLAEVADAETAPLVEPILSGGQRLLDTLNSVLDLARLEAEGAALALRPVDLGAAVESARGVHAEAASRAGLTLRVEGDGGWALADAAAVGRVLDNLIANAVRFTERGGVTVGVDTVADRAVVEVRDTGRGMSAAFTSRAAEPFVQESTGDARSHEGFGLGLTIVERLVAAMHGRLEITSVPGAGTRIRVVLPRATPEAMAVPRPDEPVWLARRRLSPLPAAYRTRTTGTDTTAPSTRATTT